MSAQPSIHPRSSGVVELLWESRDGVILTTFEGEILGANPAARRLARDDIGDLSGRGLAALVGREAAKTLTPALEAADRGESPEAVACSVRRDNGEERLIEVSVCPVTHGGQRLGVALLVRDRTGELRALRDWQDLDALDELLGSRLGRPEDIAQGVADWMAEHFGGGSAVWVRHGDLLFPLGIGQSSREVRYVRNVESLTRTPVQVGEDAIGLVASTGMPLLLNDVDASSLLDPVNARYRAVVRALGIRSVSAVPCRGVDGPAGVIAVFSNDRERRYSADDLERLQRLSDRVGLVLENARQFSRLRKKSKQLYQLNTDLRQYAHLVSHDLQEPIRTTGAMASLVGRRYGDQLDARGKEWLSLITQGAERMREMVTEVLRFVESEATLNLQRVDTGRVVDDVIADLAASIEAAGAVVEHFDMPEITADRVQLGRVFTNLISNALRSGRPGVPLRIEIRARLEMREWRFEVEDNGKGFDPAVSERIFSMRYRGEDGRTGVGLAIVQRIVQGHGGRVDAFSDPGVRTVLAFTMPDEADLAFDDTQEVAVTRMFRPGRPDRTDG